MIPEHYCADSRITEDDLNTAVFDHGPELCLDMSIKHMIFESQNLLSDKSQASASRKR
jgi:hypothetical protein